jgi:periplasmic protein TonB
MFEHALLDSSSPKNSTLGRSHYLLSIMAGVTTFALSLCVIPFIFVMPSARSLAGVSALVAAAVALFALMVCYVGVDARRQGSPAWAWVAAILFLNVPGFLIYLVWSARKSDDWRRAAMPLAYVTESLVVGALVLIPLIHMQALPTQLMSEPIPIAPPLGRPDVPTTARIEKPSSSRPTVNPFQAPPKIPTIIADLRDNPQLMTADAPDLVGNPLGDPTRGPTRVGVPGGVNWNNSTPPPPVPHIAPKPTLYRQGGEVTAARALYRPTPVYPRLALMAHIQGAVVLQAILGTDGSVQDLKVISGHPLLVGAALDAVRTWRYQPTLLNSEPVEVLTEIDVNFRLDD